MADPERHVDEAQVLLADVREFMQETGLGDCTARLSPGSFERLGRLQRRWRALALKELGPTA